MEVVILVLFQLSLDVPILMMRDCLMELPLLNGEL